MDRAFGWKLAETKRRFQAVKSTSPRLLRATATFSLFFEALSLVRAEHAEDAELLALCQSGQARGSTKMREA